MVEQTDLVVTNEGERRVRINRAVAVGDDIRPGGFDIAAGDIVLHAGDRLGAAEDRSACHCRP